MLCRFPDHRGPVRSMRRGRKPELPGAPHRSRGCGRKGSVVNAHPGHQPSSVMPLEPWVPNERGPLSFDHRGQKVHPWPRPAPDPFSPSRTGRLSRLTPHTDTSVEVEAVIDRASSREHSGRGRSKQPGLSQILTNAPAAGVDPTIHCPGHLQRGCVGLVSVIVPAFPPQWEALLQAPSVKSYFYKR